MCAGGAGGPDVRSLCCTRTSLADVTVENLERVVSVCFSFLGSVCVFFFLRHVVFLSVGPEYTCACVRACVRASVLRWCVSVRVCRHAQVTHSTCAYVFLFFFLQYLRV